MSERKARELVWGASAMLSDATTRLLPRSRARWANTAIMVETAVGLLEGAVDQMEWLTESESLRLRSAVALGRGAVAKLRSGASTRARRRDRKRVARSDVRMALRICEAHLPRGLR